MSNSSDVMAGNDILASSYNNLRTDAVYPQIPAGASRNAGTTYNESNSGIVVAIFSATSGNDIFVTASSGAQSVGYINTRAATGLTEYHTLTFPVRKGQDWAITLNTGSLVSCLYFALNP